MHGEPWCQPCVIVSYRESNEIQATIPVPFGQWEIYPKVCGGKCAVTIAMLKTSRTEGESQVISADKYFYRP